MPYQTAEYLAQIETALGLELTGSSDFDLNKGRPNPSKSALREAGVLIALTDINNECHVLLTKRSAALKHHPGQVSFAGGKVEPGDGTPTATALREAEEEIALPQKAVKVLGQLSPHVTITNFRVTPVLGQVTAQVDLRPETGEVDEIFSVPLSFLLAVENYQICKRRYLGVDRFYYTIPYGPYYIWGATARMLRGFAERMAQCN